jgi:hypothetical protein
MANRRNAYLRFSFMVISDESVCSFHDYKSWKLLKNLSNYVSQLPARCQFIVAEIMSIFKRRPLSYVIINALKPKLVSIIFTYSVRTTKKTPHFTITKINWSTLFKEIIPVYSENHTKPIIAVFSKNNMKPINILCGQNSQLLSVKTGGIYSYHWALKF